MANTIAVGMAQTVLGPVAPEDLGMTDPHEHLLLDFSFAFKPPPEATEYHKAFEPVTETNLAWVVYDPFRNLDNLVTLDEEVSISEASMFYRAGGKTMIDTTSIGIKRDPLVVSCGRNCSNPESHERRSNIWKMPLSRWLGIIRWSSTRN